MTNPPRVTTFPRLQASTWMLYLWPPTCLIRGDEASLATIRQLYLKAAEENAATTRAVFGVASSVWAPHGATPVAQSFLVLVDHEWVSETPEAVFDDGGSPDNLISALTAALWVHQRRDIRCETQTLWLVSRST